MKIVKRLRGFDTRSMSIIFEAIRCGKVIAKGYTKAEVREKVRLLDAAAAAKTVSLGNSSERSV